jgi:hypothetical protein
LDLEFGASLVLGAWFLELPSRLERLFVQGPPSQTAIWCVCERTTRSCCVGSGVIPSLMLARWRWSYFSDLTRIARAEPAGAYAKAYVAKVREAKPAGRPGPSGKAALAHTLSLRMTEIGKYSWRGLSTSGMNECFR